MGFVGFGTGARVGLVGVLALVGAVGDSFGDVTLRTILKPGDDVPGMAGFTFSFSSGIVGINDEGRMLLNATVSGAGSTGFNDNVVVLRDTDGSLSVLARENDPVPGLAGAVYRGGSANNNVFEDLVVTPGGDLGMYCQVLIGATVYNAFLTGSVGGGFTVAARVGGGAPGFDPGDTISFLGLPGNFHDGGAMAFAGRMSGSQSEDVVWFGSTGAFIPALQGGLQAPGQAIGATVGSFDRESLRRNALGDVCFGATLDLGNGITQSNRSVLYFGDPANLGVLAQTGNPVPGLSGASYTSIDFESARVNSAGAYAFQALVAGGGTGDVIMGHGSGTTLPVAVDGQMIPGMVGVGIDFFRPDFEMNGLGEVVFATNLTGTTADRDSAIVVSSAGVMRIAVREGDLVDGLAVEQISLGAYFAINDRGDVLAEVVTDGMLTLVVSPADGSGLVKLARAGEVLVTEEGFGFGLSTTTPWSIERVFGSSQGGVPVLFNDQGQVVVTLVSGFGRGAFVFDFDGEEVVCPADLTGDGMLNFLDVSAYLTAFGMMDPAADFTGDGLFNFLDVSSFLSAFGMGCP